MESPKKVLLEETIVSQFQELRIEATEKSDDTKKEDVSIQKAEEPLWDFPAFVDNDAAEIVFYDVETTIPPTDMIEFGCIVLNKNSLKETQRWTTLIHSTAITKHSVEVNHITSEMVAKAPKFEDVASTIFQLLNGRIWAGHNITTFDNGQIAKHFEKVKMKAPTPAGIIDTLPLLRNSFGTRAGNMKMSSLGNYFELGLEEHRALEDCEMTIEVFKNCCTVLFMEQHVKAYKSKPKITKENSNSTPKKATNNNSTPKKTPSKRSPKKSPPSTPTSSTPSTPSTPISSVPPSSPPSTPTGSMDPGVWEHINKAMKEKRAVWIAYNGGGSAMEPRSILPLYWVNEPKLLAAKCGQSNTEKKFSGSKIMEVRDACWTREKYVPK